MGDETTTPTGGHVPVLLAETLDALGPRPGETALDCTAGRGGHAVAFARCLAPGGTLVLNDADPANLAFAAARVRSEGPPDLRLVELAGNFVDAPRRLVELGVAADCVLADLGFASNQMDDGRRGFSFRREGPLDMRYDPGGPMTAADLVNTLPEAELAEILRDFGEERAARRVARKLVEEREASPISTTDRFASIVRAVVGPGTGRIDPATRSFQAIRIAVNDEVGCLRMLLESIRRAAATQGGERSWLAPGARVGVIAFHSLEDRLVKRAYSELRGRDLGRTPSNRPIEAGDDEVGRNPRARSAKLRVIHLGRRH